MPKAKKMFPQACSIVLLICRHFATRVCKIARKTSHNFSRRRPANRPAKIRAADSCCYFGENCHSWAV
jgi:hypothetical protein